MVVLHRRNWLLLLLRVVHRRGVLLCAAEAAAAGEWRGVSAHRDRLDVMMAVVRLQRRGKGGVRVALQRAAPVARLEQRRGAVAAQ